MILLLVAADRLSKVLLAGFLADRGLIVLIPNLLGLQLLEGGNTGAAFGMFTGKTGLLIFLTAAVLIVLLYALLFKRFKSPVLKWAVVLIVSGGIGNLYDRVAYGYVTDFFKFLLMEFPIFNVADCFITVGVVIAVVYLLLTFKDDTIFLQPEPDSTKQGDVSRKRKIDGDEANG